MVDLEKLFSKNKNYALFESVKKDKENTNNFLFCQPVKIITTSSSKEIDNCFREINYFLNKGYYLAGFLSYELGYLLEGKLKHLYTKNNFPLLWFGVYQKPITLEKHLGNYQDNYYISNEHFNTSISEYRNKIKKIKNYLLYGDTYQVNFTIKYKFSFMGNILNFYNSLKAHQKVPYSALINFDNDYILSLSPELFFRQIKDNITVKPMKGTANKKRPMNWLKKDKKNISENLMIVDLLRNDLGRICRHGSINPKKLFNIESYETLWQMTSEIGGRLQNNIKITDIIRNLFPSGSVTGAPKIRTMEIINELEKEPRRIYTGAIGFITPDKKAVFNVAIRTIHLKKYNNFSYSGEMGIGSGIVFDSIPGKEYKECLLKAKFLTDHIPQFSLFETMLCEKGKIKNPNLHLKRMKNSASVFKIIFNIGTIKEKIKSTIKQFKKRFKIRLFLNKYGNISIKAHEIKNTSAGHCKKIILSSHNTNPENIFLCHKTTNRKLYASEYKKYLKKGFFDVIFKNEKGALTEGAISNIFIKKNEKYYTPPLKCGLLNGIYRQIFMKKNKVVEKILYPKDLEKADKIILTNAVRGETDVKLHNTLR